ncbi:hypothetical protein ERO13_A06G046800v2 [Gossypium hirsutum]|uniref:Uncharacterized protein n=1 Tax=Gossypium hirsutum TaxID=3635 RepID=A0ABM3BV78_GOSHI|nr:uncharacterized protein LOC121230383 [Gossypium hirsutum]KAG4194313.1 hypothetical protein ERO13_A06G046800v2 [Gossypium hirsutum]
MAVDDSFIKPGAVPFKWEIRPGVPKQTQNPKQQPPLPPLPLPPPPSPFINNQRSSPNLPGPLCPPQKLKPPPAGSYLLLTSEPQTHSFRSTRRSHSERWRFDRPVQVHLECVSHGCFPSPLLRRKGSKRWSQRSEPDYVSDLETLSRWSVSSRKSLSPFYGSPMSSFLSFSSSP